MSDYVRFSKFKDVRSTRPQEVSYSLEELRHYFALSQAIEHKNEVKEHLSFALYKKDGKRCLADIKQITGFVCDFDFTDPLMTRSQGKDFIQSYLNQTGILETNHFWYTTFSYGQGKPNFRLVLPLKPGTFLSPKEAERAYDNLFYKLQDFIYLDKNSKVLSHLFAAPCHKKGNEHFYGAVLDKTFLEISILPTRPKTKKPNLVSYDRSSASYLETALHHIDPDLPYNDWINVGMALKHELGEQGFLLWQQWSAKGSKYGDNAKGALEAHWKSFKGSGKPITGKTITKLAKDHGFKTKSKNLSNVVYLSPSKEHNTPEVLPPEFEDEHHVFKHWGRFSTYKNIYDLSPFPMLEWVNSIFLDTCHPERHDMRLASVISVTGHIFKEAFHCPFDTNFYIISLMPTGTGKNKFLQAISAFLSFFNCTTQVCGDIGSVQGLHKHFKMNHNRAFNLVDEIAEMFRGFQQRGNENKDKIKKVLKSISTDGAIKSPLIKGEELETLERVYMSIFWTGTQEAFKYLEEDDFRSGMQGRFLYFYLPEDKCKFGVFGKENHHRLDHKITTKTFEAHMPLPLTYTFGKEIIFPEGFYHWSDGFTELLNKKKQKLGGSQDVRSSILVRAAHQMKQLAVLTCDEKGVIPWQGIEWATDVVIHSLRQASLLTQERFNVDRHMRDVRDVKNRILTLTQKMHVNEITQSSLSRSLTKMSLKRIEKSLERLSVDGFIDLTQVNDKAGRNSILIHLLPTVPIVTNEEKGSL